MSRLATPYGIPCQLSLAEWMSCPFSRINLIGYRTWLATVFSAFTSPDANFWRCIAASRVGSYPCAARLTRKDDRGRQNCQPGQSQQEGGRSNDARIAQTSTSSSAIKAAGSHCCIAELEVAWTTREPRSQSGGLERGPFFLTNAIGPLAGVPAVALLAKAATRARSASSSRPHPSPPRAAPRSRRPRA